MWVIATSAVWTSLGVILFKFRLIPAKLPKLIGRSLYWIGVPAQILVLARKSNFSQSIWMPPLITLAVLILGLVLANLIVQVLKQFINRWSKDLNDRQEYRPILKLPLRYRLLVNARLLVKLISQVLPKRRSEQGSFVLASILGNTGFVGLAIVPAFVGKAYTAWIVLYGVAHNLLGSYGLGVILASYFGRSRQGNQWWIQLRDIMTVPSLWAFAIGWWSQHVSIPPAFDSAIQTYVLFVIPQAFLLIGMQLCQLQGIQSLQVALVPTALKMLVLPGITGLALTVLGLSGDARLALILMSAMPTAFANVILAEEYNLDRQLAASSILLSTIILPFTIPVWLALFG